MRIFRRPEGEPFRNGLRRLLLAWLFAVTLETLLLPPALRDLSGLEGLAKMSFPRVLLLTLGGFLLLEASAWLKWPGPGIPGGRRGWERWAVVGLLLTDAVLSLAASFTWAFLGACLLILGIAARYAWRGWDGGERPAPIAGKESPVWLWMLAVLTAAFCVLDSLWLIARIRSFSTPTYDFGIFSQMFDSMRRTGLPVTTLERDGLLSHFAVHVSPIWYLMLPFYALVPAPETLQVLQAVILASAVIPLWKIGKLHGLSAPVRFFLCAALLLYPSFMGGTRHDVHENCFLAPLILWLLYGIDRRNLWIALVSAALTLLVKEDAAVYVGVIGLWLAVRTLLRKDRDGWGQLGLGLGLLAGAVLWFLGVTAWLARYGEGVMTYRYDNFMYDGSGCLGTVVKSVVLQPLKAVFEAADREKLGFLALSLGPLLGLPLWTRKYERLLLLIPFLLVNLMSDYAYQHDIFFQYTFGPTACLFYLTAVHLADLRPVRVRAAGAAVLAFLCAAGFGALVAPKAVDMFREYRIHAAEYAEIRQELARIPEDAPAAATTAYTTHLSHREVLYDVGYASFNHLLETDYIVLSASGTTAYEKYASPGGSDGLKRLIGKLEDNGYERISGLEAPIFIFRRK